MKKERKITSYELNDLKIVAKQTHINKLKKECQINSCKFFNSCNKIQVKGEKTRCINYKYIFE